MEIKTKWLKNQPKTNGRKSHRNEKVLSGGRFRKRSRRIEADRNDESEESSGKGINEIAL